MDLTNLTSTEHGRIAMMVIVILLSIFLGWVVKKGLFYVFKKQIARKKIDPGKYVLFVSVARWAIVIIGVGYAISFDPNFKSVTTSFLAGAGILTLIVGFAAKDVLSNMVSGIMIIVFRPFTISHWIKVDNISEGTVEEIKMLYTVIKDPTNRRLIIPNSKIVSSDVINSSYREQHVIQPVVFEISYDSDIEKAKEIIREVAEASPLSFDRRSNDQKENNEPKVAVKLQEFSSSSISLAALVWIEKAKLAKMLIWELNEEVRKRFNEAGIEFPYPHFVIRKEPDSKGALPKDNFKTDQ